jgi:hypothetical protein
MFDGQFDLRNRADRATIGEILRIREDPDRGNVSTRILIVINELNNAVTRRGYTAGNMVHHSDEAGRPFLDDVDLPAIAFVPRDMLSPYAIENKVDLSYFVQVAHGLGYVTVINPAWRDAIVAGHYHTGYYR